MNFKNLRFLPVCKLRVSNVSNVSNVSVFTFLVYNIPCVSVCSSSSHRLVLPNTVYCTVPFLSLYVHLSVYSLYYTCKATYVHCGFVAWQ